MRKCKRVSLYAAAFLCAGFLSGCQAGSDNLGNQVTVQDDAGQIQEERILTFFAPVEGKSSGAVSYREMIDRYNGEHSSKLVFEGIATADGYDRYLEERLDAGAGDDVFIVNEDSVKPLYTKNHFYDLSALPAFEKLNANAKSEAVIGDIAYCIPMNMTAYALYVNLDVLEKYGLTPPKDLEDFNTCCETMKEQGQTPISLSRWHATAVPTIANGLYKLYNASDHPEQIEKLNTGELQIGDYMLEGFGMFREAVQKGWYGDGVNGKVVDSLRAGEQDIPDFASGRTAFYFGPLEYTPWVEETNPKLDYQVQGVPVSGGTVLLTSVVSRLCVNPESEYLEDALDFVTYLSDDYYRESVKNGDVLLPVYENVEFELGNERMRPAYETYLSGVQIPAEDMQLKFGCWDTVRELCLSIADGMTDQEAADQYNRIQKEQLEKYKQ